MATYLPYADPRSIFLGRLSDQLFQTTGAVIELADLARAPASLVWILTLRLANGAFFTLHAPIQSTAFAYGEALADDLAHRIGTYLKANGLG